MKRALILLLLTVASGAALAKLPALSDEAKAKAAEASAKAAWSGKVDGYLLCKSQDRAAASYFKTAKAIGKDARPVAAMPACADPGAFTYAPPEAAKSLESSGAHSPAPPATSPPGGKQLDAVVNPAKKS